MENSNFQLTDQQKAALQKLGVVLCYLHGSIAAGTPRTDSDADVAVLFENMPEDPIGVTGKLIDLLTGFIPGRELDIAILNEASPLLKQAVAVHGQLLYEHSLGDGLQFQLDTMDTYEDHLHFLRFQKYAAMVIAGMHPAPLYE